MCSFLYTTKNVAEDDIPILNKLLQHRGPDDTKLIYNEFGTFIHNRLKITNDIQQPYENSDCIIMLNGEIYNDCLNNELLFIETLYKEHGDTFASYLDGEFSIVILDKNNRKLLIAVDTFKTKPLWYSLDESINVATYKSPLIDLNCKNILPFPPNSTIIINLKNKTQFAVTVTKFNTKQFKNSFDDWINTFNESLKKRTNTDKKIGIGLSSGYDSGCIAAFLVKNNINFNAYTVSKKENINILQERKKLIKNFFDIPFTVNSEHMQMALIHNLCELSHDSEYNYISDKSSAPLMKIGHTAKKDGCKIFLSGTGCDEIIGDYYIPGQFLDVNSCFFGKYPKNLKDIFPWKNFFNGTMRKYLTKDEYIIGSLGLEARYPFLDKKLVQEFLNLSVKLKNINYKSPLREYLIQSKFPFSEGEKRGFSV